MNSKLAAPANDTVTSDGRKLRSVRSRAHIIKALFKLIRKGSMNPSAAQIAEEAGVSLRTVFRHIEDMESLHREMAAQVAEEIAPMIYDPLQSTEWRDQLNEIVNRRVRLYEHVMPIKVAANLRRFHSDFLLEEYNRSLAVERDQLLQVLPEEIASDDTLLSVLVMATSFQIWRRLRQDQKLSPEKAKAAILLIIEKVLAHV